MDERMMQQINLDFLKSYEQLLSSSLQKNDTEYYLVNNDIRQFYRQWKGFFAHHGYFDVPIQSTIGIAACVAQKINKNSN